jgi:hypothetical protein
MEISEDVVLLGVEKLIIAQVAKKFASFMEPECSIPCPQDPATGPYPEPV